MVDISLITIGQDVYFVNCTPTLQLTLLLNLQNRQLILLILTIFISKFGYFLLVPMRNNRSKL